MEQKKQEEYIEILKEQLRPAMGCTEPIAVAYAAALARKQLPLLPEKVEVKVSGNIIKNVKSVIVPNTGGLKGIPSAVAAGVVAGNAAKELEVIADIKQGQIPEIQNFLKTAKIVLEESDSGCVFDIQITEECRNHSAFVQITDFHTNVVSIKKDGEELLSQKQDTQREKINQKAENEYSISVEEILDFANTVPVEQVKKLLDQQIEYNMAIAKEGLTGQWGAQIGKVLLSSYGDSVANRAKAMAAAGSDARMSGCEMPVVINSGSGNQGITTSVPIVVYAQELKVSREKLYRALLVSNLVSIHLKQGIGCLSAYCGAISAGCGAAAGIAYLYDGDYHTISHTIVNAIAIDSGVICDGAKPSCAAKIASSLEAGLLGLQMTRMGKEFYGGDGIVKKGVENTIENVGRLARDGMKETDKEIIHLMIG